MCRNVIMSEMNTGKPVRKPRESNVVAYERPTATNQRDGSLGATRRIN